MKVWRPALRSPVRRRWPISRPIDLQQRAPLHTTLQCHQEQGAPAKVSHSEVPGDGSSATQAILSGLQQTKDPAVKAEIDAYLARNRISACAACSSQIQR